MIKYTENSVFKFSDPKIYKDKDNKKWYVEYYISYPEDDGEFRRIKLYGKNLNREPDIKKRERRIEVYRAMVEQMLSDGEDPKNRNSLVEANERLKSESGKYSFDVLFEFYCNLKGYTKTPKPKQRLSSVNVRRFFNHQLKPFLVKNKLDGDLRLVTKKHILDFLNHRYLDKKNKWSNSTYNNIKTWIGSFFNCLIAEDKLDIKNPCSTIKSKPKVGSGRYEIFSKEELSILFNHLDEKDFNLKVAAQMIYYAYVRESEIARLKVSSVDLEKRVIKIKPDDAKGQVDGLERDVLISKELHKSLSRYLEMYETEPDDYLFGKKLMPGKRTLSLCWHQAFKVHIDNLKKKYDSLFTKTGLTMYALKHSGVTHFVNDNIDSKTAIRIHSFVQSQCRHTSFQTTQIYLRKLPVTIKEHDEFAYEGF